MSLDSSSDDAAAVLTAGDTRRDIFLSIEGLWKAFGDFYALKDVSLEVLDGEFICFLGPSGCGKTTLLRAIAGLDLQTRGVIEQNGRNISNLPPVERDYGIVFQSYALFPNLTVEKNIAFGLENAKRDRADIQSRVDELLTLVDLPRENKKYPSQLSGGQQQRVALARAIATSPGLLLLDEPLSALDAKVRVRLRHEIKELQRKLQVTTILVTHDQEEALAMADKIVVMNHGVIEQVGTPTEIYRQPASLFVADFIGETNQFLATVVDENRIRVGDTVLNCMPHLLAPGTGVTAVIRPEDIIPTLDQDSRLTDNVLDVSIGKMEFLGSYWRTRLNGGLNDTTLIADLSVNALRRLDIKEGLKLSVELPQDRLLVFPDAIDDNAVENDAVG